MTTQASKVTPTLPQTGNKVRKSLTLREAAYLAECAPEKILLWADLGEYEIKQAPGGRRYVDYAGFMDFLGEPIEQKGRAKW